jgi:hypothetical protein
MSKSNALHSNFPKVAALGLANLPKGSLRLKWQLWGSRIYQRVHLDSSGRSGAQLVRGSALGLSLSGAPLWGSTCPGLRSGARELSTPYPGRFRRRLAEQSGVFQRVDSESPNKPLVNIYRSDGGSEIRVIN